jgi:hypothetical protein
MGSRKRVDLVAVADVERQLDARVDLRLAGLREVAALAPLEREVRAGVDGVRRVDAECVEAVAVERSGPSFANSIATELRSYRPFVPLRPRW